MIAQEKMVSAQIILQWLSVTQIITDFVASSHAVLRTEHVSASTALTAT
jgi:hypothetical protein